MITDGNIQRDRLRGADRACVQVVVNDQSPDVVRIALEVLPANAQACPVAETHLRLPMEQAKEEEAGKVVSHIER